MIELILMCAFGKPTTPCPPPPPPPVEIFVGLPAKEVELVEDTPEQPENQSKQNSGFCNNGYVQKSSKPAIKSAYYNRRGKRNH